MTDADLTFPMRINGHYQHKIEFEGRTLDAIGDDSSSIHSIEYPGIPFPIRLDSPIRLGTRLNSVDQMIILSAIENARSDPAYLALQRMRHMMRYATTHARKMAYQQNPNSVH